MRDTLNVLLKFEADIDRREPDDRPFARRRGGLIEPPDGDSPAGGFHPRLRGAEVRVSVAETLDAHRVVGLLGFQDRAVTKDALAVTLAKSADEKTRFDAVFERFFSRDLPAAQSDAAPPTADDAARRRRRTWPRGQARQVTRARRPISPPC